MRPCAWEERGKEEHRKENVDKRSKEVIRSANEILKVGIWNVLTLLHQGKLITEKREMSINRLQVLGISEVRWGKEQER